MHILTTDTFLPENADLPEPDKGKVACIGSGPASLACAAALRLKGYDVTVFEALPKAGGSLSYIIPEHKLAQQTVDEQIRRLEQAGIKIIVNTPFCTDFNAKKLEKSGFQAVFLGLGLWEDKKINVGGADLNGVFNATAFLALTKFNALTLSATDSIVILGNDRLAAYCAAVSALKGAEDVFWIIKNRFNECASDKKDIAFAQSLGVSVLYGFEAKKFIGKNGNVFKFRGKTRDGSGEIELKATKIICSFGRTFAKPNAGCALMLSKNKLIEVKNFSTLKKGYFSGGSAVRGEETTLFQSVDDGQKAAEQIDIYLKGHINSVPIH